MNIIIVHGAAEGQARKIADFVAGRPSDKRAFIAEESELFARDKDTSER